jgi:hypothetical protein
VWFLGAPQPGGNPPPPPIQTTDPSLRSTGRTRLAFMAVEGPTMVAAAAVGVLLMLVLAIKVSERLSSW